VKHGQKKPPLLSGKTVTLIGVTLKALLAVWQQSWGGKASSIVPQAVPQLYIWHDSPLSSTG
jgi:hypothetical protein